MTILKKKNSDIGLWLDINEICYALYVALKQLQEIKKKLNYFPGTIFLKTTETGTYEPKSASSWWW